MTKSALDARARLEPPRLIQGEHDDGTLNKTLNDFVWRAPPPGWFTLLLIGMAGTGVLFRRHLRHARLRHRDVGQQHPVGWAFGIINFVWWIGIGHAGTLISAILLLFQQKWRTSINRFAEAMTIFAGHAGRPVSRSSTPAVPGFAYWMFPYRPVQSVWPQFKSPLMWTCFAVSTYFTTSLLFWYIGLIPDLASLRDATYSRRPAAFYGIFAPGLARQRASLHHYKIAYLLLAGLATPLVLSVHTIVSWDFALSILPGWHTPSSRPTSWPAPSSPAFAMVLTLIIPARRYMGLSTVVTERHLDNMAKVMLCTGLIVSYGYLMEHFAAWYSGNLYEEHVFFFHRPRGPYAWAYFTQMFCNVVVPQIFWLRWARRNIWTLWVGACW